RFAGRPTDRGRREAPGAARRHDDLQPLALLAYQFHPRHARVLEQGHRVLDTAQTHELVAGHNGHTVRVVVEDERGDAAVRHLRHNDHDVRYRAVGGPQLAAVKDVAVLYRRGRGGQARGVGAHVRLG